MTAINVKLTIEEIQLLASLASDQLFRKEFIDPKMPGHKANPSGLRLGKQLVERLQNIAAEGKGPRQLRKNSPTTAKSAYSASAESPNSLDIQLT